jgi:uncharacterized repeat protein (TIGR01451 family)
MIYHLKSDVYLVCNVRINLMFYIEGDITMSKVSKIAAGLAVAPVLAFSAPVFATGNPGQIEFGDIYRAKNVTTNSAFADNVTATCGQTVQFRVRIHNGGPATLTNVKVAASLVTASGTSHGSTVTVTADNNLDGRTVTANAGVTTDKATTATYVSGSTQLLNYSITPGGESVIANLPDGILSGGVNVGSVGPTTPQTEEVQFQAKLNCETTPPVTPPVTPPTTLVNTGAGSVAGIAAAVAAVSAVAYGFVTRRAAARQ